MSYIAVRQLLLSVILSLTEIGLIQGWSQPEQDRLRGPNDAGLEHGPGVTAVAG